MEKQLNHVAFVFPGQGSQSVGMLSELVGASPEARRVFAEASEVLGFDLWRLVQEGPEEQLNLTVNTQPAMLAAGVAVWEVWRARSDLKPGWMAGHSLGEYTALVCSGALRFGDALTLVRERARFMQEAVPAGTGAMAAILGLESPQVVAICNEISRADFLVRPANFNAPGQVVIAGHAEAVARAMEDAKAAGAKRAVPLPVSVPSHCPLMQDAADRLFGLLENTPVESPDTVVVHNADVGTHTAPEVIRHILAQQLSNPVRWVESVRFMHEQGVVLFLELGPGKVLTGLNKRIVPDCTALCIHDTHTLNEALEIFQ
jgi:[acyl-carrier-protein] S-malonyltransferase